MANLTGFPQAAHGDTTQEDTSAQVAVGTRQRDGSGNEYIYLQGTASTVAGSWVTFDENYTTTLTGANAVGPVAVAGTATVTGEYGWYQIYGKNTIAGNSGSVAADKQLYLTSNSGYVDDADVAGDAIIGAVSRAASSGSAVTVWLNYPYVSDSAID